MLPTDLPDQFGMLVVRFSRRTAKSTSDRLARVIETAVQIAPTTHHALVA